MARAPLLQLSSVALTFGGNPLFQDVSLSLQEGERLAMKAFDRWKECHKSGVWPGYSDGFSVIDLPKWARMEMEVEL